MIQSNKRKEIKSMSEDKSDHNRRFHRILENSEELLKEKPWLLQNHLDVKQILWLVKNEKTDVLEVLLQDHSPSTPDSIRALVEMVVVSGVFYEQNPKLLMSLSPWMQQHEWGCYIQHIKGAPSHPFLQLVEPNVVLPSGSAEIDEILTAMRSKRVLNENIISTPHSAQHKKL